MAFVYCRDCRWGQDDFYSESYNPAKSLLNWNTYLFGKERDRIDEKFTDDCNFIRDFGNITTREFVAQKYDNYADRIRTMKWITWEDYKNDPHKVCPKCKSNNLMTD